MEKKITVALAGNPNSGKTTIFNNLTGSCQHVGNYPGVTVEKKEGSLRYGDYDINVVDLPGTYSLTAHSLDEVVARDFVIEEKPDVVIDIIDASNLERGLYLATQFLELGVPLVLAFNMYDIALKHGLSIDRDRLSELLGSPIVFTVATKKKGMEGLVLEAIRVAEGRTKFEGTIVKYGREIREEVLKLEDAIVKDTRLLEKYPSRWLATKLLEKDAEVIKRIKESPNAAAILAQAEKSIEHLTGIFGDNPEAVIADRRYGFISGACSEATRRTYEARHSISDEIDKVLVNRGLGLPIFLGVMWLVFKFTFGLSAPLMRWIEWGQNFLGGAIGGLLPAGSALQSLVTDGVIGGVGSVLVFTPMIFLLFLALAFLEDSGYMARAAFIMDRFMHFLGLHGRSFIPMLLGFGCNVPAIMATRAIEDRRDRMVTILVNPFMSCGARLPIYTLFIGAFFPGRIGGNVLFSIYLLGIIVAVIMAKILRRYVFKGEAELFVMELPPYRIPTLKGLFVHMWERGSQYLKKAGTIIFIGCVAVWFLSNFPWKPPDKNRVSERLEQSYAGRLGRAIVPGLRPLGFGDWKVAVGLISGLVAKENLIGTLGTLYSAGEEPAGSETLREKLRNATRPDGKKLFTPLAALSLMVFVLLYMPCIAAFAVIKKETNSWKWPLFTAFYTTAIAWLAAFTVYNGGRFLQLLPL